MIRIIVCLALALAFNGCLSHGSFSPTKAQEETGGATNMQPVAVPINQVLMPAGKRVEFPKMRPQVIALSPDGRLLVTSGPGALIILDPATGRELQRVTMPGNSNPSYTGLIFSDDGKRIYLSDIAKCIKVFDVGADHQVALTNSIPLPPLGKDQKPTDVPAGLALSHDGTRLYVAYNLSNLLVEIDIATGKRLRSFEVGVAPFGVAVVGDKAYVSNWGGRRPDTHSVTGPAGAGEQVRVDPVRFIANEGSVSVIDLKNGAPIRQLELLVGLHPSGIIAAPDGRHVLVANAGSDTVSVIDTREDRVVETILVRWHPDHPLGVSPNALAMDRSGKKLYVCNGTQNAVAVVAFNPGKKSELLGLIPTDWYPGAIAFDPGRKALYVANIKGIGSGHRLKDGEQPKFNSHEHRGTLTLVDVPGSSQLEEYTRRVLHNANMAMAEQAALPPRKGVPPRPVPERVGEPSVFKHVVYIIKENRTYDQVLGDMPEGNGEPSLCIFGEKITPNQHKICREFVLLDNTYCSGVLSADGHQWTDSAFATDYIEKAFMGFPRSYPFAGDDALAASSAGYIWDNAMAHGKTFRDYGEFTWPVIGWTDPEKKPEPTWLDYFNDFIDETGLTRIGSKPNIASLNGHVATNTVGWEMMVPDVIRADKFIKELRGFERRGRMPELIILFLPEDHTAGTGPGFPTPEAMVADNDLAMGWVVEAISRSRFWKDTCIFAIEDDPQAGVDHISSYRTTAYVASAYTKRHAVVSANYTQTGILRTIELILGLPPMNQIDAASLPMTACFTDKPDFTPFTAVPNNILLDEMNPEPNKIADAQLRRDALASAKLPLAAPDLCPEDLLNRILWRAQKGSRAPYPEWAVCKNVEAEDKD